LDFPEPHRFGVWWDQRRFKIYRNLSLVKSAITNDTDYSGQVRNHVRIYEHDGHRWQLIYELNKGDRKDDHELWVKGRAPKTLAVSDESVEAAIASILGTAPES
jgi:hypothetical protein